MKKNLTLETILKQQRQTRSEQIWLVLKLSIPAILAQLTSIVMQYIDAAMVGSMGAGPMAAIGLMSTSTWLIGGMCVGLSSGFSVQVAQLFGGEKEWEARDVFRQGMQIILFCGIILSVISLSICKELPVWLGGDEAIIGDAGTYFMIYSLAIPFDVMRQYYTSMIQSSGDMRIPGILSGLVCILDVIFNLFLIFPSRQVLVGEMCLTIPGANLGVAGAALGTALAQVVIAFASMFMVCVKSEKLSLKYSGEWRLKRRTLVNAIKIAVPMTLDHIFMCSAYIVSTLLVAPLGTVAVAANSLAITAESICYMPGYGIGVAATVIVGHTIGAKRKDLTKSFSWLSVMIGVVFMSTMAVVMYFIAPNVFHMLTSDVEVADLGVRVIRIELLAEPFYAMSICCNGVFRGAGDTLIPGILNLVSMWGVRIGMAVLLVPHFGLPGYWIAMSVELCFRGIIFLVRMMEGKWMNRTVLGG